MDMGPSHGGPRETGRLAGSGTDQSNRAEGRGALSLSRNLSAKHALKQKIISHAALVDEDSHSG